MKEAIEDLIKSYKGKIELLKVMKKNTQNDFNLERYQAKKTTYQQVVRDLTMLLEDEQD